MTNQTTPISITDLAVLKNLIDVACERGAFRAAELSTVGAVYDKLTAFLASVVQQAEEESKAQSQGEVK